jgi:hypothetical protein
MSTVPKDSNIKAYDTYNCNFVEIGNNVVIVHNTEESTERRKYCKSFYVFNKSTRERLHIHIGDEV